MKLAPMMIAVAAMATVSGAQATVERLTGASASSVNVAKALRLLCSNAGGSYLLYKTSSSTSSLGNVFTATCSVPFTGTVDQVRVNVSGGSLNAVLNRNGNPGATTAAMINPAAATCTAIAAGTASLSFALANEMQNCAATGQVQEFGDGGYLDVEGPIYAAQGQALPSNVVPDDFVLSSFLQVFGVGVSPKLYSVLQEYQVAKGLLDASCATAVTVSGTTTFTATNSTTPLCQPNISKAAIASFMASGSNKAKTIGANILLGANLATQASDLAATQVLTNAMPAGSNMTYCRRPATSGTQASAQAYFLSDPTANGELGGAVAVASANSGKGLVVTNSGSSDVRVCMNDAATYRFGIISMENNPIGGSDTYRFVKLDNRSGSGGVSGDSQTTEAIAGRYDFVFESVKYCPGGDCTLAGNATILEAIDTVLPAGASTAGIFLKAESNYSRRGKATRPYMAKP